MTVRDQIRRVKMNTMNSLRESNSEQSATLTVEQAAGLLGISRGLAYEGVRRGEIPSIRIGRRMLVPRHALLVLLGDASPTGDAAPRA
jgi:excisionase family DNA binding protein